MTIIVTILIIAAFWTGYYLGQDDQKDYDKLEHLDNRMMRMVKNQDVTKEGYGTTIYNNKD